MRRRTTLAVGALLVGLTIAGSAAVAAQDQPAGPADTLDADQVAALEAIRTDAPIPVVDADGVVRGTVHNSELTARDERVLAIVVDGFRERQGEIDQQYDELFEALRILDPVPVVDDAGATVGYWTHNFKEPEQLDALRPTAQQMVDVMLAPSGGG